MDRFAERLAAANIENRARTIQSNIDAWTPEQHALVEAQAPESSNRLNRALEHVSLVSASSDAQLVTPDMLNRVVAPLDQLQASIQNFQSTNDVSHVGPLDGLTDNLIDAISLWPAAHALSDDEIRAAASTLGRTARRRVTGLGQEVERVHAAAESLASEIASARTEFQNLISQQQSEASARLEELQTSIEGQKDRLDQAIATFQQQFSEAQERRSETFQEQLNVAQGVLDEFTTGSDVRINELAAASSARLDELEVQLVERRDELLANLEESRNRAREIVGVIAATGTASAYGKEAKTQSAVADTWRWVAIAFALIAAGIAAWAVIHAEAVHVSVGEIVTKVLATIVFTAIAGYAATQSSQHRTREERAKRRELELTVFAPFTESLPAGQQDALRQDIARKYFGQDDPPAGSSTPRLTEGNITLLGQIIELLSKMRAN